VRVISGMYETVSSFPMTVPRSTGFQSVPSVPLQQSLHDPGGANDIIIKNTSIQIQIAVHTIPKTRYIVPQGLFMIKAVTGRYEALENEISEIKTLVNKRYTEISTRVSTLEDKAVATDERVDDIETSSLIHKDQITRLDSALREVKDEQRNGIIRYIIAAFTVVLLVYIFFNFLLDHIFNGNGHP